MERARAERRGGANDDVLTGAAARQWMTAQAEREASR